MMVLRVLAVIGVVLGLTACAPAARLTPEAQCFAAATEEYRAAWREARGLEADLARGYALHPVRLTRPRVTRCREGGASVDCLIDQPGTLELPVAIDLEEVRQRLAAAEARMARLRPQAVRAAAPCAYVPSAPAFERGPP